MKEQRQFTIIGIRAGGYHTLEAVELTPDILSKKLVRVVGQHRQGKTSLLNLVKIGLGGLGEVQKREALEKGFYTEVNLIGCGINLFLGVRVSEFSKGESKGEPKIETFIYSKKPDGSTEAPVLDGKKLTAAEFSKMVDTGMTFGFNDVFSNQPTEHKRVIEKMYSSELGKLGADAIIAKVNDARTKRDLARGVCDSQAAFMEQFENEGWSKADLELLSITDISAIDTEIISQSGKRQSAIDNVSKDNELAENKAKAERVAALQAIKDDARKVVDKVRAVTKSKEDAYRGLKSAYDSALALIDSEVKLAAKLEQDVFGSAFLPESEKKAIGKILVDCLDKFKASNKVGEEPIEPNVIQVDEMGIPTIPETYDADYSKLVTERQKLLDKYAELRDSALVFESVTTPDVSAYDKKIAELQQQKASAEARNKVCNRFAKWQEWIEAKTLYEDCMDELANLYAKVDTGIEGLKIYPMEGSRSMDLWLKYDGVEDPAFFDNTKLRPTFLFEYSAMQRAVLGVMIQASRLEKKDIGVRVCVIDEIPMTKLGIDMMERICEKYDVQLMTSYPDDRYDTVNPEDGVIIVEGGEVFFSGMKSVEGYHNE